MRLIRLITIIVAVDVIQRAVCFSVPEPPYDVLYTRDYQNMPSTIVPCITIANVFQSIAVDVHPSLIRPWELAGCSPPSGSAKNILLSFSDDQMKKFTTDASPAQALDRVLPRENGVITLLFNGKDNSASTSSQRQWETPVRSILAAIRALNDYRAEAHAGKGQVLGCVFHQLQHGGLGLTGLGPASPLKSTSPYGEQNAQDWAFLRNSGTPMTDQLFQSWTGMTILLFPDGARYANSAAPDDYNPQKLQSAWDLLVNRATFNNKDLSTSSDNRARVYFSLETYFPMWFNQALVTKAESESAYKQNMITKNCLTLSKPTCWPSGGLSVWGFSRKEQPSRIGWDAAPLPRNIARKSIGIFTAGSSQTLFSDVAPAADAVVSGIVATMLVMHALTQPWGAGINDTSADPATSFVNGYLRKTLVQDPDSPTRIEPSQLQFSFFQGENWDLAGSARFLKEIRSLNCMQLQQGFLQNQSCFFPYYKLTNFTSVLPEEFTHMIHLEQLGYGSDVFAHFDQTAQATRRASFESATGQPNADAVFNFTNSTAQQWMKSTLQRLGANAASSKQLPPNSLFAFHQVVSNKNAVLQLNGTEAYLAAHYDTEGNVTEPARSQYSGFAKETVLMTLSSYNATYVNPYLYSIDDLPRYLNLSNIVRGAQVVLDVLGEIWWAEYQGFLQLTATNATARETVPSLNRANFSFTVDSELAQNLWYCFTENSACSFLSSYMGTTGRSPFPGAPRVPSYHSGSFGFYDYNTLSQILLKRFAFLRMRAPPEPNCSCDYQHHFIKCENQQCYREYASYTHAFAPSLDYLNQFPKYFNQSRFTAHAPLKPEVYLDGVPNNLMRSAYAESIWSNDWGTRVVTTDDSGSGVWMFVGGLMCTLATPVALIIIRAIGNKLKTL